MIFPFLLYIRRESCNSMQKTLQKTNYYCPCSFVMFCSNLSSYVLLMADGPSIKANLTRRDGQLFETFSDVIVAIFKY